VCVTGTISSIYCDMGAVGLFVICWPIVSLSVAVKV
jgi:hypothetical protein